MISAQTRFRVCREGKPRAGGPPFHGCRAWADIRETFPELPRPKLSKRAALVRQPSCPDQDRIRF